MRAAEWQSWGMLSKMLRHAWRSDCSHAWHSIGDPAAAECTDAACAWLRLAGIQVEAFAVHPGGIQTSLQRHLTGIIGLLANVLLALLAWLPFVARIKSIPQVGLQNHDGVEWTHQWPLQFAYSAL
jgi:hypothetical protein